jgi:hypothetical protein
MIGYWRERFNVRLFLPAAAGIALASGVAGERLDAIAAIGRMAPALLLLAQFRLWDDLADRERDRGAHPARVLVRAADLTPFAATCVWLGVFNLCAAAWRGGVLSASLLALLNTGAAIWYGVRLPARTAAADMTVLAKYPVFVLILAGNSMSSAWALAASASAVYAAACAFELWHDATSPLRVHNS